MIKKILLFKIFIFILFFSIGADAALQWKVGAFIGTFATGVAVLFGLAGAAPIVVAGTLAVGVHAAVIGLYWDDINPPQSGSAAASSGFSVVIDANTPFVTPANWNAATIGTKEPTPPNLDAVNNIYSATYAKSAAEYFVTFTENSAFLDDVLVAISTNSNFVPFQEAPASFDGVYIYSGKYADMTDGSIAIKLTHTISCNQGYSLSTDNLCHLSNAQLVQKPSDNICESSISGGTFKASANDPDCKNTAVIGLGTATLTAASTTKAVYLATATSGSVTVYEKTYNPTTNTTSLSTANFNPASDLDFIQTANSLGNNVGINPVNGGTGAVTGTGDAKDSSLNPTEGGDEPIGNSTSNTGGVSAPENGIETSLNPLKNWAVPVGLGSCPTGTFEAFNKSFTLNSHCTLFNENSTVIRQAMGVVFTITALFIVLGA